MYFSKGRRDHGWQQRKSFQMEIEDIGTKSSSLSTGEFGKEKSEGQRVKDY